MSGRPTPVLAVLVIAQLAGTSPWFAANAVLPQLIADGSVTVAGVTGAVQAGFVLGTLVIAGTGLADRFSARRLFLAACFGVAASNALPLLAPGDGAVVLLSRALVGLTLAGVYPIGMKLAATLIPERLGSALGWLVGALVLGTASGHLLRALGDGVSASVVLGLTSGAAMAGGLAVWGLLPDAPQPQTARPFTPGDFLRLWAMAPFRRAALGYFGHMWELYTLWALAPVIVASRFSGTTVSLGAGMFIALGAVGCVVGGLLARRVTSLGVARIALTGGLLCGLAAPWMWEAPLAVWLGWLGLWGVFVAADSPQLSTLTARAAPPELLGSGLAITTSIGFALTVVSVMVAEQFATVPMALVALSVGPSVGLLGLGRVRAAA